MPPVRLTGSFLGKFRAIVGLTQRQAAEKLRINPISLSNLERGCHRVSEKMAPRLAQLYRVTVQDIEVAADQDWENYERRRTMSAQRRRPFKAQRSAP